MKAPKSHPQPSVDQVESDIQTDPSPVTTTATGAKDFRVGIMQFGLQFDVPLPLEYFNELISRSGAFSARAKGKLELEEVRSRAAVKPSELARYLRNEPRVLSVQQKVA